MHYRSYSVLTLVFYFIYFVSRRASANLQREELDSNRYPYLENGGTSGGISQLRNTISSIDNELADYQKRTCRFGLNNHHCALAAVDGAMNAKNWLNSFESPGKRSLITNPEIAEKYSRILDDIYRKRQNLAILKQILQHAEKKSSFKTKRSCSFNLGGVCATELASAIADQYYYLNGPNSPGKRRRRAVSTEN